MACSAVGRVPAGDIFDVVNVDRGGTASLLRMASEASIRLGGTNDSSRCTVGLFAKLTGGGSDNGSVASGDTDKLDGVVGLWSAECRCKLFRTSSRRTIRRAVVRCGLGRGLSAINPAMPFMPAFFVPSTAGNSAGEMPILDSSEGSRCIVGLGEVFVKFG